MSDRVQTTTEFVPFPLLRLPCLALNEVLQEFELTELTLLTFLSQKSAISIALAYVKLRPLALNLDFNQQIVQLEMDCLKFDIQVFADPLLQGTRTKINGISSAVQFVKTSGDWEVLVYCGGLGMQHVVNYLDGIFRCKITSITLPFKSLEFKKIARWLLRKQYEIESLTVTQGDAEEKELAELLKNLWVTKDLNISLELSDSFQFEFQEGTWPRIISISHSKWITLDHLLSSDSERIELQRSSLTNQDLDVFMKKWRSGEFALLSFLDIRSDKFDGRMILDRVPPFDRPQGYYSVRMYNRVDILCNALEFPSENGQQRAMIRMSLGRNGRFRMMVQY